jgi:hypothetical protein
VLRRLTIALAAVLVALTAAAAASADIVKASDAQGRTITYDVLAPSVDLDWYTGWLRTIAHGDEISRVTIRIVPNQDIVRYCGAGAAACYNNSSTAPTMVVAAGRSDEIAHGLIHEYGHHLDSTWPVAGVSELNGTPGWWAARGMASLLSSGSVAFDYSRGWDHSVGEIFAEDYASIYIPNDYRISWLAPPDATLKAALLAELGASAPVTVPAPAPTPTTTPPTAPPPTTSTTPVTIVRSWRIANGERRTIPFQLLGPGRHVKFNVVGSARDARVSLEVVCDGKRVATATFASSRTVTLDRSNLGPARCEAAAASKASTARTLRASLELSLEPAPAVAA